MSKTTTVNITLSGKHEDVMEFVNMAIGDGLVQSFNIPAEANGHKPSRRILVSGDRVEVTRTDTHYGVNQGDKGRILGIKGAGKGHSATVSWDDGTESAIAVSILKKVRK